MYQCYICITIFIIIRSNDYVCMVNRYDVYESGVKLTFVTVFTKGAKEEK